MSTLSGPVIIPLDGSPLSETILLYAVPVARALGLPVCLLYTVDPHKLTLPDPPLPPHAQVAGLEPTPPLPAIPLEQAVDQEMGKARVHLEGVAANVRAAGLTVDVQIHEGAAGPVILEVAEREHAALIAMSTHGRSGIQRVMLGSVTDHVVHKGHVPMLVARPPSAEGFQAAPWYQVVLPLDGSDGAAQAGVPVAAAVAKALSLPLHLCRVVPPLRMGLTGVPGDASWMAAVAADTELPLREAEQYLAGLVGGLEADGLRCERSVIAGLPEDEIGRMAEPHTLIVMATHGRTGLARMVLGSVADRVMHNAHSAVLLVPRHK